MAATPGVVRPERAEADRLRQDPFDLGPLRVTNPPRRRVWLMVGAAFAAAGLTPQSRAQDGRGGRFDDDFILFRMGKYKGGLMCIQNNRREMPFRELAARTLGYQREGIKPVGIERSFNNYLKGVSGKRLMQKISGNNWAPVHKEDDIEATDGSDLYYD